MNYSQEQVEEYISELEELADKISNELRKFFRNYPKTEENNTGREDYVWKPLSNNGIQYQQEVLSTYHEWYGGARELIGAHFPEDLDEFKKLREDFQKEIQLHNTAPEYPREAYNAANNAFHTQRGMVKAIPRTLEAQELHLRQQLSKDLTKSEIHRSRALLEDDLLRASGVVAGVALERHLLTMCEDADLEDYSHDDGITSLATTLYSADEIEKTTLKSLETLGGIRSDCAHVNQKEPNEHKVKRLIDDAEDYIRGRGI